MNAPIFITGCPRSGVSMTAGILWACGAFGGANLRDGAWSRKERWENREFMEKLLRPFLILCGADPRGQYPIPDLKDLLRLANLRTKIETMMKFQGYKAGLWFLKADTLALIWPTMHEAFPDAKWVVVRRSSEAVVKSCMSTAYMNAYKTEVEWSAWVATYELRFRQMIASGLKVREIWPSRFVCRDFVEAESLVSVLGLRWNDEAVSRTIWPNRREIDG